jgi:hypothetical protein
VCLKGELTVDGRRRLDDYIRTTVKRSVTIYQWPDATGMRSHR